MNNEKELIESTQRLVDLFNPEEARERRAKERAIVCGCLIVSIIIALMFIAAVAFVAVLVWKLAS